MAYKPVNTKDFEEKKNVEFKLSLFSWDEDSVFYVYAPALDLTGYGLNKEEAKESFQTVLNEFLVYTHDHKTIFSELEKLGWTVNKKRKRIVSPDFEDMLSDNRHFKSLYKSKDLVKETSSVNLELV